MALGDAGDDQRADPAGGFLGELVQGEEAALLGRGGEAGHDGAREGTDGAHLGGVMGDEV